MTDRQVLVRTQGNYNPHTLLARIGNGTATFEDRGAVPQKTKHSYLIT